MRGGGGVRRARHSFGRPHSRHPGRGRAPTVRPGMARPARRGTRCRASAMAAFVSSPSSGASTTSTPSTPPSSPPPPSAAARATTRATGLAAATAPTTSNGVRLRLAGRRRAAGAGERVWEVLGKEEQNGGDEGEARQRHRRDRHVAEPLDPDDRAGVWPDRPRPTWSEGFRCPIMCHAAARPAPHGQRPRVLAHAAVAVPGRRCGGFPVPRHLRNLSAGGGPAQRRRAE
jgi:hypothetical protein